MRLQPLWLGAYRLPFHGESGGRRSASGVFQAGFWFGFFFNLHIAKLFGVKDLATILALDVFGVIVPGNYSYPGMLTNGCHRSWVRWENYSSRQIVSAFSPV